MSYTKQEFKKGNVLLASELNAMDEQIYKNSVGKVNLPTDENGNVLVGKKEQILMSNGDGTTQWADSVSFDGGSNDGIPFQKRGKLVQFKPAIGSELKCVSTINPTVDGVSKISITRCGKNLVNITNNPTNTGAPPNNPSNIDVRHLLGDEGLYLTGQALLSPIGTIARIRAEFIKADGSKYGLQGNDVADGTTDISKITPIDPFPTETTSAYFAFFRGGATTQYGYSNVQIEVGDTMTDYEPYSGDTYEVNLGRTVYGGSFDWTTGELAITHELVDGVVTEKAEKETVTLESKNIYALSTASGINTIYSNCGETIVSGYTGTTGGVINSETIVTLKYKEKNLLAIGDSITQQGKFLTSLQSYVPFALMDNQGIGGSTVIKRGQNSDGCILIDSLETNVKNADVITIGYGTNDTNYIKSNTTWSVGELAEYGSEFDKNSFYGAYQYVVEKVLTWNSTARIILIVPASSMIIDSDTMTYTEKRTLMDSVAQAVRDVANYYSLDYVDLYYKSGMNEFNRLIYAPDGVHPQEEFGDITARKLIPILLY